MKKSTKEELEDADVKENASETFSENLKKSPGPGTPSDPTFLYSDFHKDLNKCGLKISSQLVLRTIASLCTKRFLIFTGLSGSGKTKLAIAFAKWITGEESNSLLKKRFKIHEEIQGNRVTYKVTNADNLSVTFTQIETGTKVTLPYELIEEWIVVIKEKNYTLSTPPRKIRKIIDSRTKYSTQLNSFETHLKAAAFYLLNKTESISIKNSQVCIIPVGSDWINREPLVGFPNALKVGEYVKPDNCVLDLIIAASSNPNKPFFLILDEMNLSHVERYFADFLSVMESSGNILLHPGPDKWSGIPSEVSLPENLFIIGTVNIDETTYMFSPKVLDRANVIEFRLTKDEISEYLNNYSSLDLSILESKGTHMAESFLQIAADQNLKPVETEKIKSTLIDFFIELRKTEAEFGYRTASEIMRFVAVVNLIEPKWSSNEILDAAIMQKLLPKVHGSRKKLAPVLEVLGILCMNEKPKDGEKMEYFFNAIDEKDFSARIKFPKSFEKISRMYRALLHNGFTSYAEA